MAERGLSAARLAKDADVKPSFIYDVLHGKSTNPSIVKLARIATSMQVGIEVLVKDEGLPSPPINPLSARGLKSRRLHLDTASNDDYVAIPGIHLGYPSGDSPQKAEPYRFQREWLRTRLGVPPTDLRLIVIRGDSMEPSLCAGDTILVDITKRTPTPPGIFVLFDGFGLVAKRLEFIANTHPPAIRVISDNPQYSAYQSSVDALNIIGRVVWFAREL